MASALALALLAGCAAGPAAMPSRGDILINGTGVHPESVTSSRDGSLFTGSNPGIIYRAGPRDTTAEPFITPNAENGLRSTYGVLADDMQGRLWVCSVAPFGAPRGAPQQPSEVVAFELGTGKLIGRWPFPGGGTCNDIAIGADGAAYATDTPGGRILKLPKGGNALQVVAADDRLKGIDGIAISGDGKMYINNVQKQEMWRVELQAGGAPAVLTRLNVDTTLAGPDGLRPIGGNRFLQAEGTAGRITLLTITGDSVKTVVLREGLQSSPGVTLIGNTAYAVEGKINYLFDAQLRGKDPGPFKAIAIPLPR
jgi:sugar lactone lactonase YvrE